MKLSVDFSGLKHVFDDLVMKANKPDLSREIEEEISNLKKNAKKYATSKHLGVVLDILKSLNNILSTSHEIETICVEKEKKAEKK